MGAISGFYDVWDNAFEFFNVKLFDGRLPDIGFTVEKQRMTHAYFHPKQFVTIDDEPLHKVSMNTGSLGRTDELSMSTFVHELVHHDQYAHAKPGRGKYHNKQWCQMMIDIGLMPRNTKTKGTGMKATGDTVTHDVINGGLFDLAFDEWQKRGLVIGWRGKKGIGADGLELRAKAKRKSKTKFICGCSTADCSPVWGKPSTFVMCGYCGEEMLES